MKIGIFGGSFDPPTMSHLMVGEICSSLVDRVVFVPAWNSPLKHGSFASFQDRWLMTILATNGNDKFSCSSVEKENKDSHMFSTLSWFREKWGEPVLIVGADCWESFHLWWNFDELLRNFEVIVVGRPGFSCSNEELDGVEKRGVSFVYGVESGLSSTIVRDRLELGLSCRYLVPDAVLSYIVSHGLYFCGDNSGDGGEGLMGG